MENTERYRIPVEKLKRVCNCEKELDFCQGSMDVPPLGGVVGQERAVRSMQFGLKVEALGYNIFVAGPSGSGKSTYVQAMIAQVATQGAVPADWCYIHNFNDHDRPLAVTLPAGHGRGFQKDMDELITELRVEIPKAFESNDFGQQKDMIVQSVQQRMEALIHIGEREALDAGFNVKQSPQGLVIIPIQEGQPLSPEEYEKLPAQERRELDEKGRKLQKKLDEIFHEGRILEKQANEQIIELEKQIALYAAGQLVGKLKEKYQPFAKILDYLEEVLKDIAENLVAFKAVSAQPTPMPIQAPQEDADPFVRYKVNLFVNNEKNVGAPVVTEPSPYYYNLFGKIEYRNQMMAVSTDFTMAKAGAIHRANGGYLILQAKDILNDPFAWDALKKALKYKQAVVENIGEQYRYVPTVTLRPEPIPLNVKVILIGSPLIYYLYSKDEDFQKLFKVKVDFDVEMRRTPENICQYVSFVSSLCRQDNLKHFNRAGLGKVIEYGSRLAGHQDKLSTRFSEVSEIVYEAVLLAESEASEYVDDSHVNKAIQERRYRSNTIEEKIQELILQQKILIDTQGAVVGQINGLAVMELGGYMFGRPSRITARTYAGRGGIINIERETEMSGSTHSKGVLTLAGYLGGKFAQKKPLGMTAQITFEQNYEGVDGDSASSTELYAVLSSLAGIPIKQSLAVTGSVNQHGEIQPIGGATEKIEGFFDICVAKGLTGEQGVVIPASNIDDLMLKDEVLSAVKESRFHIYAVNNIEEGIELLSGVPAGSIGKDGQYPEGSVFYLADRKLQEFNKVMDTVSSRAGQGKNRLKSRRR